MVTSEEPFPGEIKVIGEAKQKLDKEKTIPKIPAVKKILRDFSNIIFKITFLIPRNNYPGSLTFGFLSLVVKHTYFGHVNPRSRI